jgi:hypothetical protein
MGVLLNFRVHPSDLSWMGTNLNWCADWDPEKLPADLAWSARPWALGTGNADSDAWAPVDSQGWPTVTVGTTFGSIFESAPWAGVYKLRFTNRNAGTGDTVTSYSGNITLSNRAHDAGTNVTTYDVTVPSFVVGQYIWLRWAGSTGGLTNCSFMRPLTLGTGWHPVGTPLSDHVVNAMRWFGTIRTMQFAGGVGTGLTGGTDTSWAGRTKPWSSQTRSSDSGRRGGVAWENVVAVANQLQRDVWVNVPFRADDVYILRLAQLIRYGSDGTTPYTSDQASPVFHPLDSHLNVYIEHGNEIWNGGAGYPANENYALSNAEIAAGDANHYTWNGTGNAWEHSWRRVGWLAVRHSLIFRSVFGDAAMMTRVRPVVASQHGRYATTSEPLNYIAGVWGAASAYTTVGGVTNPKQPVSYYLYALATAPYVPDGNSGITVTSAATMISTTLANLNQTTAGKIIPAMTWNHDTAAAHGIGYVAYEGGDNLIPELMPGGATPTSIQNAVDASYSPTLGAGFGAAITNGVPDVNQSGKVYGTLFKEWRARGGGIFCHYTFGQAYGSGSMFGLCPPSSESKSDPRLETGPKWDAVKAFSETA